MEGHIWFKGSSIWGDKELVKVIFVESSRKLLDQSIKIIKAEKSKLRLLFNRVET